MEDRTEQDKIKVHVLLPAIYLSTYQFKRGDTRVLRAIFGLVWTHTSAASQNNAASVTMSVYFKTKDHLWILYPNTVFSVDASEEAG